MTTQKNIIGLQYIRGIAAIGVVIDHASGMAAFKKYFGSDLYNSLLKHGAIGVDLFFLISGFIIATSSLNKDLRPAIPIGDFLWKRFARIVPLMWIAVTSYALLKMLGRASSLDPQPYINSLLLLPWGTVEPDNIWTLRHELLFYTVFAFTFLGSRQNRLLMIAWVFSPLIYNALGLTSDPNTMFGQFLKLSLHPVNIEFGAGLLIGLLWPRHLSGHLRTRADPMILLSFLFLSIVSAASILKIGPNSIYGTFTATILCAPILLVALALRCPPTVLGQIGLLLGNASYAIYLFHLHIESAALGFWAKIAPETPIGVVVAGVSAASIVGGVIVHKFIERPLLRALERARTAVRPAVAPAA